MKSTIVRGLLHGVLLSLALTFAVTVQAKEKVPDAIDGTTKVMAEDVIDLAQKYPDLVIIDARIAKDRLGGYIEGSISLPDTDTTPESLAKAIPTKDTHVLFYCNGVKCGRSVKSSRLAVQTGYTHVFWFRGGWEEWTAKGMPVAHD